MGRRADPPAVQAAKGHPGKRKSKVEKRQDELDALAARLAAAPANAADTHAPPMLVEPMFAPALQVWARLAPELARTHRLPVESRDLFVALCVYTAEYYDLAQDVALKGLFQRVKRTNGSWEEKRRPAVDFRDAAFENMLKLSSRFGLTPLDIYGLFKDQAAAATQNPGLFNGYTPPAQPGADESPTAAEPQLAAGVLGAATRLKSEPPPGVH